MKQQIAAITLATADIARARRFYADALGWTPGFENDHVLFFQMNGFILCLYHQKGFMEETGRAIDYQKSALGLAHNVCEKAEVDAVLAQAQKQGARLLKPATDQFWGGYSGYFADPDGHIWEVAWNPFWTISPEGYVTLGEPG